MALFGFNKQKVLATAEKYVQQGKAQNAISEYEKVLKNDPKDLTVTNTVGDLYSRLGEIDKATDCFKTVGDAYASQGFTVKAIAMYKKISKLKPSLESLLKLAELYTQQGLFNDARAQYLQVAEEFLKSGELENAVRIFQKILEMDPENSTMRVRLAEVYVRLGKKTEAWQIFSAAAESLRSKGSLQGAEEILQRMLTLDPGNTYALLMQGKNLLESGDAAGAAAALNKISDIDSHTDGLKDLLKAYLQTGQLSEAGAIANKLLTVHNDLPAISSFAEALMQAGQYENALQVYDQHAERLLAENSEKVLEHLHTIIGHVRENPDLLQKLLDLFNKAGESTHISEVLELLAHASVQAGDLPRARDLYQRLAQVEPQNPLHMQNYQQVVSQLGGTSGAKLITPEEAVVLIDDLEATAPAIHQHYSDEVALSVRSALTDAELFISYNMPQKALGPLLAALPLAPSDQRINQRLAALHTRASRFAEAALCCRTLQHVYSDAGYPDEATRYGELADRYDERSSNSASAAPGEEQPIYLDASTRTANQAAEFSVDETPAEAAVEVAEEHAPVAEAAVEEAEVSATSPWPAADAHEITVDTDAANEFAIVDESASTEAPAAEAEIDLSSEWDDSVTVEADAPAAVAEATAPEEAAPVEAGNAVAEDIIKVEEAIEEIRFYLAHDMHEQALAALAKLQTLTQDQAKIDELRAEVEAATPAAEEAAVAEEPAIEEITVDDIPSAEIAVEAQAEEAAPVTQTEEIQLEAPQLEEVKIEEAKTEEVKIEAVKVAAPAAVAHVEAPAVAAVAKEVAQPAAPEVKAPAAKIPAVAAPVAAKTPAVAEAKVAALAPEAAPEPESEPASGGLKDFVTDLESSLGEGFLPGTVTKPAEIPAAPAQAPAIHAPAAQSKSAVAATPSAPVLGEFVADIEASLGEDFLKAAPVPEAQPAEVQTAEVKTEIKPPAAAPAAAIAKPAPLAAGAAASAAPSSSAQHTAPASVAPASVAPASVAPAPVASVAWSVPAQPAAIPVVPPAPAAAKAASPFAEDAGVDLAEMFGELKQDLEAGVSATEEDPETHYNLGIAFREMGLLDEAIGELQKACQSSERGRPFPQIMQTYTWLAQCFLEKGVPEAAVRWYDKALGVPGIDGETRVALHYELAAAYETSGDKTNALKHFMDVYGTNIDYRDVAERIKALKS
jgi:tetratricopeptide (TPR) repeat protein